MRLHSEVRSLVLATERKMLPSQSLQAKARAGSVSPSLSTMRKLADKIEKSAERNEDRSAPAAAEEHCRTLLCRGLRLGNVAEELQNSRLVLRSMRLMKIDMARLWHEPK